MPKSAIYPDGLRATLWDDPEQIHPGWVGELFDIPGVERVVEFTDRAGVAVDTTIQLDEDGIGEPDPELLETLVNRDGWNVRQVKVDVQDEPNVLLRVELCSTGAQNSQSEQ